LASGALARCASIEDAATEALAKSALETYTKRFTQGIERPFANTPIPELLGLLNRNTIHHAGIIFQERGEDMPDAFLAPSGASVERIAALEKRLDITLPQDYKESLRASDGFAGSWNNVGLDPPLSESSKVAWTNIYMQGLPIFLHQDIHKPGIAPLAMGREYNDWPQYTKGIQIGDIDVEVIWLLPPAEAKKVLDAYAEFFAHPDPPHSTKDQILKLLISEHGSWEEFERIEWILFYSRKDLMLTWGSFRSYLEHKVWRSEHADA
jgi:hypothetical protein